MKEPEFIIEPIIDPEQDEHPAEAKPSEQAMEEEQGKALLNSLIKEGEDDDEDQQIKHIRDLIQVIRIDGQWFRRQIGVILLMVFGIILYITNRYQAQSEIIEEGALRDTLQDMKFRNLTRNSELTLKCRQSKLEELMKANGDSTLLPSTEAPFILIQEKK